MTQLAQARTEEEREAATANTYQRKIQELRHAIAFEQNYSKDWILERYLNLAYFGDGAYGVQAAARHYFSVNASQLNTIQSATLAGLVKNPVGFDPTRFTDRAIARRNVVLNRMAELDVVRPEAARGLVRQPLGLKVSKSRNGCLGSKASFFCDYVRRYLMTDPSLGRTPADRAQLINSGGLTIKTTLDLDYQRSADAATDTAVNEKDQAIGALAMVKPGTGEVMAISQSRPMGRDRKKGETFLNYVVDSKYGDSQGFQAGSTFKVFVLAAALEQGLSTSTRFRAPERISIPQNDFATCNGPYPVYAPWSLGNSTGSGTFDMITGTRQSVNTYYAQLERQDRAVRALRAGQGDGRRPDGPGPRARPLVRAGGGGCQPAGDGRAPTRPSLPAASTATPARSAEILNSEGKVFKKYPKKCEQVMQESTADTVNQILAGVHRSRRIRAGARSQQAGGREDRDDQQQHGRVVQRLHADPVDRSHDRRGELPGTAHHPQRGHRRWPLHRRGLRVDGCRPHVGPGHAGDPGLPAVRVVLPTGAHG